MDCKWRKEYDSGGYTRTTFATRGGPWALIHGRLNPINSIKLPTGSTEECES